MHIPPIIPNFSGLIFTNGEADQKQTQGWDNVAIRIDSFPAWSDMSDSTKSIKFRATFPKAESYGLHQVKEVVFSLGLGPCGRHVLSLSHEIRDDLLTITQKSRLPNDLEEPDAKPWHVMQAHTHAVNMHNIKHPNKPIGRYSQETTPAHWVEKGPWYNRKRVLVPAVSGAITWHPVPEGFLQPDRLKVAEENLAQYWKDKKDWLDRLEVKQFVYKMTDVHGRIEIIK